MDGWTKNSLKCTTSHSGGDTGEIVIFGQTTVNRKDMGENIIAYGGRILLGFQSFGI